MVAFLKTNKFTVSTGIPVEASGALKATMVFLVVSGSMTSGLGIGANATVGAGTRNAIQDGKVACINDKGLCNCENKDLERTRRKQACQ